MGLLKVRLTSIWPWQKFRVLKLIMTFEQLKTFLSKVKADSNLQVKLKAAKLLDEVVAVVEEYCHGFTLNNSVYSAK